MASKVLTFLIDVAEADLDPILSAAINATREAGHIVREVRVMSDTGETKVALNQIKGVVETVASQAEGVASTVVGDVKTDIATVEADVKQVETDLAGGTPAAPAAPTAPPVDTPADPTTVAPQPSNDTTASSPSTDTTTPTS